MGDYKGTRLVWGDPKFGYEKHKGPCYIKQGRKIFYLREKHRKESYYDFCKRMRMSDPELHNDKFVPNNMGLTDKEIAESLDFIPQDASLSHTEQKLNECSKTPVTSLTSKFSLLLREI